MTANKSKTVCILPWIHMYANADGNVLPCCIGDYKTPLGNTGNTPIKEIWNNSEYKKLRLQMLNNEQPSVCRQCWKHEEVGNESSRIHMNTKFAKFMPIVNETNDDGSLDEMKLRYMDIRWSNICNFKCRTCSATYSSSWAQEDGKDNIFIFAGGKNNDSLYEQFKEHYKDIEFFYFAGGEKPRLRTGFDELPASRSTSKRRVGVLPARSSSSGSTCRTWGNACHFFAGVKDQLVSSGPTSSSPARDCDWSSWIVSMRCIRE